MNKYRAYGMRILSDMEFPQLVRDKEPYQVLPEVEIVKGQVSPEIRNRKDVMYEFGREFSWLTNSTLWITVENGRKITYELKPEATEMKARNYLLGWGIAMLGLQRNILAMHCSVVADEKGAVLISGESGVGKSTLTTAFLANGYRLIADDMTYVETAVGERSIVYPAFPYQKLCRNVALEKGYHLEELIYVNESKDKFLVPYKGEFPLQGTPIKGFIMLYISDTEEVMVSEVNGFERFRIFANNLFLRHLLREKKYAPEIGKLCLEMAANVPVALIGRPLSGDSTQEVVQKAFVCAEKW